MNRLSKQLVSAGAVVIAALSLAVAETNFSRVNGFEPRFLPPTHASYKNVKADYNAKGDGKTDDTQAFLTCLNSGVRTIYIPAGTYVIKDQLRVRDGMKRTLIIGECRTTTVLKLADASPGFGDPAKPKAFLHTRAPNQFGEQNMHMYVYHLTIEIGAGNPGAVGLNFHTNNTGAVKDVAVRATDPVNGKGLRGIAFDDYWFGPGNGRYLEVEGFRSGIYVNSAQNHTTLEHVNVSSCDVGLEINGYPDTLFGVSCRDVRTVGCGVGVSNEGFLVLVESSLAGSGGSAIDNKGTLLCRATTTTGFTKAISSNSARGDLAGPAIDHYTSDAPAYLWAPGVGLDRTLGLPVQESPEYQYPSASTGWTVIGTTGDVGQAVNQAITNGATDIFLTGGRVTTTIGLKGTVRRIMGLGVRPMVIAASPGFRLEDGTPQAVIVELVYQDYGSVAGVLVEQASTRAMVFRHGSGGYRNTVASAGGRVFIESVVGYPFTFTTINAWLRDIDTEQGGANTPNIVNDNAKVWILGHKTEDYATKIHTINNGFSELLGGTYRQNWDDNDLTLNGIDPAKPPPLFSSENANVSLSYKDGDCYFWHKFTVREVRGTESRDLARSTPLCGAVSLYTGYAQSPAASSRPGSLRASAPSAVARTAGVPEVFTLHGRKLVSRTGMGRTKGTAVALVNGRLRFVALR